MAVDLYLLRHGPAEERGPDWPDDSRRPLTHGGRSKTRAVARGLRALGVAPGAIFSSPLVRARETAEIVAAELGRNAKLCETPHLEPGGSAAALFAAIRAGAPGADGVMLVGHEPDLGLLASRLLTLDPHSVDVTFKKPTCACLTVDSIPPSCRATLRWLLAPDQLRAIGRAGM